MVERDGRPEWVRTMERVGEALVRDTPGLVSLDRDDLLDAASAATGLSDFGGDDFLEPLDVLVASLDREAKLTLIGRILARSDVLNLLQNRLRIADRLKREPAIRAERVERPLFIIGLPRSGTTILHELLAQDPGLRAPLTWEARFPCPPATDDTHEGDPRIAEADRIFTFWNELVPAFRTMHEIAGHLPCECIQLTAHAFRSDEFLGRQQTPSYGAWLATADMAPAYAYHRLMLQLFQSARKTSRWVLKAPSHMGALDALLAEYPDACVIQTHRDPTTTTASTVSLLTAHAWMRASEVDVDLIRAGFTGEGIAARLDAVSRIRDRWAGDPAQFHDVRFADLMERPLDVIRGIYARYDMAFGPELEERFAAYLAAKPRGKHGQHDYRVADSDEALDRERSIFRDYMARHAIPWEAG